MFEGVQGDGELGGVSGGPSRKSLRIADAITVTHVPGTEAGSAPYLLLEWEGGAVGDLLADATVALILQVVTTRLKSGTILDVLFKSQKFSVCQRPQLGLSTICPL